MHGDAKAQASEMLKIHEVVKRNIERANERYKARANRGVKVRRNFQVGALVWIHLRKERFSGLRKNKLMPRAEGPYTIIEKYGDNAYKLDLEGRHGVSATFNVGDLSPYFGDEEMRGFPSHGGGDEQGMLEDDEDEEFKSMEGQEILLSKRTVGEELGQIGACTFSYNWGLTSLNIGLKL